MLVIPEIEQAFAYAVDGARSGPATSVGCAVAGDANPRIYSAVNYDTPRDFAPIALSDPGKQNGQEFARVGTASSVRVVSSVSSLSLPQEAMTPVEPALACPNVNRLSDYDFLARPVFSTNDQLER